jgi:hypothetical protein
VKKEPTLASSYIRAKTNVITSTNEEGETAPTNRPNADPEQFLSSAMINLPKLMS